MKGLTEVHMDEPEAAGFWREGEPLKHDRYLVEYSQTLTTDAGEKCAFVGVAVATWEGEWDTCGMDINIFRFANINSDCL